MRKNNPFDSMVYELYFPDEIKTAGCEILKHLTDLPELKDNWSDEQKLAAIEKLHSELFDPAHPVSIAMKKMQTVPEVRIIEGESQGTFFTYFTFHVTSFMI